jgi:hypothetical protein
MTLRTTVLYSALSRVNLDAVRTDTVELASYSLY